MLELHAGNGNSLFCRAEAIDAISCVNLEGDPPTCTLLTLRGGETLAVKESPEEVVKFMGGQ